MLPPLPKLPKLGASNSSILSDLRNQLTPPNVDLESTTKIPGFVATETPKPVGRLSITPLEDKRLKEIKQMLDVSVLGTLFPVVPKTFEKYKEGTPLVKAYTESWKEISDEQKLIEAGVRKEYLEAVDRDASPVELSKIMEKSPSFQKMTGATIAFVGGMKIVGGKEQFMLALDETKAIANASKTSDVFLAKLSKVRKMSIPQLNAQFSKLGFGSGANFWSVIKNGKGVGIIPKVPKVANVPNIPKQLPTAPLSDAEIRAFDFIQNKQPIPLNLENAVKLLKQRELIRKEFVPTFESDTPNDILQMTASEEEQLKNIYNQEFSGIKQISEKKLFDDIKNNGGMKIDTSLTEEMSELPKEVVKTGGLIPDEMLETLNGQGYNFESLSDMFDSIKEIKSMPSGYKVKETNFEKNLKAIKRIPQTTSAEKAIFEMEKKIRAIIRQAKVTPNLSVKQIIKPPKAEGLRNIGEQLRAEARGGRMGKRVGKEEFLAENKELLDSVELEAFEQAKAISKYRMKETHEIRKEIGALRKEKKLGGSAIARLKEQAGIEEWRMATKEQLKVVLENMKKLSTGDRFLTEKQLIGLEDYLQTFENKRLVTQRELTVRFGENKEILDGFITKHIPDTAFPTVDVKEGHPIITEVVDEADYYIRLANKEVTRVNKEIDDLMIKAEKTGRELGKRKVEIGDAIFKEMSGMKVVLTPEEKAVANYLKNYFEKARKDIGLEKYRKNYITNIEKTFLEKLKANSWNLIDTIKKYTTKDGSIPIDLMLALDNIVGSEKFFRFALERKGGINPTTNIRRIVEQYTRILETKKALDIILPKGQAVMQLFLQKRSAVWMKRYLQNLKGRALDYNFKSGKGSWISKGAERIIDFGYIRLLAFNYRSAIKNIIGGEANSLVYQTFTKYLTGKKRLLMNPKQSFKVIAQSGLLDGSYYDLVRSNFISKSKRMVNMALYGGMEGAEFEIRGSYFLGELTEAEFATGYITPERFRKILDDVAITQGIYTKTESPLFVQTTLGRSVMQFGRWKITNMNLIRRVSAGAKKEWANKNFTGENTRRLLKLFTIYSIGTYLAYEAGKAGWKEAKKFAESSTELINIFLNFPEETMRSITDNPLFSTLDSVVFSFQELMNFLHLGDEPQKLIFRSGIEDLYFSGIRTAQDFGLLKDKKKENGILPPLPKLPKLPALPKLPKLPKITNRK